MYDYIYQGEHANVLAYWNTIQMGKLIKATPTTANENRQTVQEQITTKTIAPTNKCYQEFWTATETFMHHDTVSKVLKSENI